MEFPSGDLVALLNALLPGFLAAAVFYALTPYPRRDALDRVIGALIFTLFAHLVVAAVHRTAAWIGTHAFTIGEWTTSVELAWGAFAGIGIGVGWAHAVNNGLPHAALRSMGTTRKTSLPTPWYHAFAEYERFLILNLKDGRRLMGWPLQWPDEPHIGHFLLESPGWVIAGEKIPLHGIEVLLFPAELVEEIEFLRFRDDHVLVEQSEQISNSRKTLLSIRKEYKGEQEVRPTSTSSTERECQSKRE